MPHNHRGERLFGNYRPTPRLARLVAERLERSTGYASDFPVSEAQGMLNNYRGRRDYMSEIPADDIGDTSILKEGANTEIRKGLSKDRNAINQAIRER